MKNDKIIQARVPNELQGALERERKRLSKENGKKMKTSAVIRLILERDLFPKRRTA